MNSYLIRSHKDEAQRCTREGLSTPRYTASPHLLLDLVAIFALPHSASTFSLASVSLNYTTVFGECFQECLLHEALHEALLAYCCQGASSLRSHCLKFPMSRLSLKSDPLLGYKSGVPSVLPCCTDLRELSLFPPCTLGRWLGPTTGSLQKPMDLLSKKKDYPRACKKGEGRLNVPCSGHFRLRPESSKLQWPQRPVPPQVTLPLQCLSWGNHSPQPALFVSATSS